MGGYNREVNQFLSVVMLLFGAGLFVSFVTCGMDVATVMSDERPEPEPSGWGLDATADAIDAAGQPVPVRVRYAEEDELLVPGAWAPPSAEEAAGPGLLDNPAWLAAGAGLATLGGLGVVGWLVFGRGERAPRPSAPPQHLPPELQALYAFEAEAKPEGRTARAPDQPIPLPFAGGCLALGFAGILVLFLVGPINVAFMIGTYFDDPSAPREVRDLSGRVIPPATPRMHETDPRVLRAQRAAERDRAIQRAELGTEHGFLGTHQPMPVQEASGGLLASPAALAGVVGLGVFGAFGAIGWLIFGGRRDEQPPVV